MIPKSTDGKLRILSLSYGKDSLACLGALEKLGWPLDGIVHAEVWFDDDTPADLPPMVEFKAKADAIILERYGLTVEHVRGKYTYHQAFYLKRGRTGLKTKFQGIIYGYPMRNGQWCLRQLKLPAINKLKGDISYIGIAADEKKRFHNLKENKQSPLVAAGWDEAFCRKWCEENDLLSPIYTTATRGGCWFCHNQGVGRLRLLRHDYPELWEKLLALDIDSPVSFHPDGHTVHDFDRRFQMEDDGIVTEKDRWKWAWLDEPPERQMTVFDFLK